MAKATGADNVRRALRVLCAVLLMALLVGILATEIGRTAAATGSEPALSRTLMHTDSLTGYVFRNEEVLSSGNRGPVEYLVADGATVNADQPLVNVYYDDNADGIRRERAAALYGEIARLEASLSGKVTQKEYYAAYIAATGALSAGKLQNGLCGVQQLADRLAKAGITAENEDAVRARIADLRAEVAALTPDYELEQTDFLRSGSSGRFSCTTDGYEALLGTAAVTDLTPEKLSGLLAGRDVDDAAVGKLIKTDLFYMVIPTDAQTAAGYTRGQGYTVRLADGSSIELMLEKIALSGEHALLILRGEQMPEGMDLSRRLSVELVRAVSTGIAVPRAALREENGVTGVYVAVDGVARWRRVSVLAEEHGCCLVQPMEEEGYLARGERILITVRRLYEGKVLR